jgi:type I restriction enzyme S subunit
MIPVPSIEKQYKIAEMLDKFDTLISSISIGLPAEIEVRRQQYEYYREKLLTFKPLDK